MSSPALLIPILVPLGAFTMIFGIYYLRTRERMAMIERGMNPKQEIPRPEPYRNLKNGLLFLGAGLGLLIAYFIVRNMHNEFGDEDSAVYFACIAIGGGLGLVTSYVIEKKETLNKHPQPPSE